MEKLFYTKLNSNDILNILKEKHRLLSPLDPDADPNAELNSDSTVKDWKDASGLLPWYKLYPILNEEFNINASSEEWMKILEPSKSKKLIDLCEFISTKGNYKHIKIVSLFGKECLEASIFKRIKKKMEHKKNIRLDEVKPTSFLSDYLEEYFDIIISETIFLSKGSKIIEKIEIKRKTKFFNLFEKQIYEYSIPNILTFRDLVLKICNLK